MSRFFLICFDVSDDRRLRKISNEMENFATRVQRSIFECNLEDKEIRELKNRIAALMNEAQDQVRYYPLCSKDLKRVLINGSGSVTGNPDFHVF